MVMREWATVFPEEDRTIYEKAAYTPRQAFGNSPALLIIDVVRSFTGSEPKGVLEAIDEHKTSCGTAAWEALPRIARLLQSAREAEVPVVYTKGDPNTKAFCGESTKRFDPQRVTVERHSQPFPEMIAPKPGEFVLEKTKASAFFGTPLAVYLNRLRVDCLLVAGCTTSGCVRASVVDGFSYGYPVFVVEDCCFDRSRFSHLVNLFEMNVKYADVITSDEAIEYLRRLRLGHMRPAGGGPAAGGA